MIEECKITNEAISPRPERRSDVPESPVIPHLPNILPSSKDHFHKERFAEILSSIRSNIHHVITILPNNLQIAPHTNTEIALEEKMISVLKCASWTEYTFRPIINPPMPPLDHVLSVYSVHYNKPSKHFD